MNHEFVKVDGVTLHVERTGSGPPLVLLHGFTGSGRTLARTAEDFADRFETLRIDLLGHGQSDAPDRIAPYAMERCAGQVAAVIERLAGGRAHLLGYSMGGRVALSLAAFHPEQVRSALLVGARAGIESAPDRARRIAADERLAADLERCGLEAFVDRWMALPLFASQARIGPAFLAEARRQRLGNCVHGLVHSLRGMGAGAQRPLFDRLASLRVPTLVAVGAEDERFLPVAEDLAARIPAARLAVVPAAGHAAHLENPEAFRRIARDFLADVEAAPAIRDEPLEPRAEDPCRASTGRA